MAAEVDGNRTRQAEILGLVGFEDRGAHQDADTSSASPRAREPYHRGSRLAVVSLVNDFQPMESR
jgi:hypothetical protein